MESYEEWLGAYAALAWQVELGVEDAVLDAPINRYDIAEPAPIAKSTKPNVQTPVKELDPTDYAKAAVKDIQDINALQNALNGFEHCDLRNGARNTVFADGIPSSRVMIIGEAPGRDEDQQGKPFVGRAGQLLDKMFAAIGLSRASDLSAKGIYITNVIPWRPPQNREPTPQEIAMMVPFLQRHIELVAPEFMVVMGNTPMSALLGMRGITKHRGTWGMFDGKPVLPMVHPAYLLRNPIAKRDAWADLLSLKKRMEA